MYQLQLDWYRNDVGREFAQCGRCRLISGNWRFVNWEAGEERGWISKGKFVMTFIETVEWLASKFLLGCPPLFPRTICWLSMHGPLHLKRFLILSTGLAVGVGFGAVGKSSKATFESARLYYPSVYPDLDGAVLIAPLFLSGAFVWRNLAIGIGIQNFPEGLAVSLPLRGSGLSVWKSFWWVVGRKIEQTVQFERVRLAGTASWVAWWSPWPGFSEWWACRGSNRRCLTLWPSPPEPWSTWSSMISSLKLRPGECEKRV